MDGAPMTWSIWENKNTNPFAVFTPDAELWSTTTAQRPYACQIKSTGNMICYQS